MEKQPEFSAARRVLFPIHGAELKKFLQLSLLFLCISVNYGLLRAKKDVLVITLGGAETISYLKLFAVTPSIILFTILYNNVTKSLGRDGRFRIVIGYFFIFYTLYLALILPNSDSLQLNAVADNLTNALPRLRLFWEAIRNWHASLFYIHAEIWGSYALSVAFWTFANAIVNVQQAKRFYSVLMLGANVGAVISGQLLAHTLQGSTYRLLYVVIGLCILLMITFEFFVRGLKANPEAYQLATSPAPKKKKMKLSFSDSMAYLFKSKYLMLIAVLVLSYGMSVNLFEAVWKSCMKAVSGTDRATLDKFYGLQLTLIGLTSMVCVFIASATAHLSWRLKASVTPIIGLVVVALFFSFLFFSDTIIQLPIFPSSLAGHSSVLLAVYIGLGNVVLFKATKYVFFDASKETAYIPLEEEAKVRGKAAVDGVGGRLGKSLGSVVVVFLINVAGNGEIASVRHYIAGIIFVVLTCWLTAVAALAKRFNALTATKAEETKA